jgi:tetratricopeptide (TPR) repeat protein
MQFAPAFSISFHFTHPKLHLVFENDLFPPEGYRAMSKTGIGALVFLWVFGLGSSARAAARPALEALSRKAEACVRENRYAQAAAILEQACALARKSYGLPQAELGMLLNNQAWVEAQAGHCLQAGALYQEALLVLEKQSSADDPELADSLAEAGGVYLDLGYLQEAETALKKAWRIRQKILPPGDPDMARTCAQLAKLRQVERRYTESESWLEQAEEKAKQCWGPEHPETLALQEQRASLYAAQQRYNDAAVVYQTSLLFQERTFGPQDPRLLNSLLALADLRRAQGAYDESSALLDRALEIAKTGGLESAAVAETLDLRGRLLCDQNEPQEAEPLLETGLGIRETILGAGHPLVAETCFHLAEACRLDDQTSRAEGLYLRAMNVLEASYGPQHYKTAEVAARLGALYENQGRFAEAVVLCRSAVAGLENRLGPDDPAVRDMRKRLLHIEARMDKNGGESEK